MFHENFHMIRDTEVRNEMYSPFLPELTKSCHYHSVELELPSVSLSSSKNVFKSSFKGKEMDGVRGVALSFELPSITLPEGLYGRWKTGLGCVRRIAFYQDENLKQEFSYASLVAYQQLFSMESEKRVYKAMDVSTKIVNEIESQTVLLDIPFFFTERPSTFFPTFRAPDSDFSIEYELEIGPENLELYEKKNKEYVESERTFSPEGRIANPIISLDCLIHLSEEDKIRCINDRKTEIINVFEVDQQVLHGDKLSFKISERETKYAYYALIWLSETSLPLQSTTLSLYKNTLFKDRDYKKTHLYYPLKHFRAVPDEKYDLHAWANCVYSNDMGPKAGRTFALTDELVLSYPEVSHGQVYLIKCTQVPAEWRDRKLVILTS